MTIDDDDKRLREEIERRAYQLFCDRGCHHGDDVNDWLAAEREIVALKDSMKPEQAQRAQANHRPHRGRAARS